MIPDRLSRSPHAPLTRPRNPCTCLVQLNIRKLLEDQELPPINIICQKVGSGWDLGCRWQQLGRPALRVDCASGSCRGTAPPGCRYLCRPLQVTHPFPARRWPPKG
jgi:hypothetical protein